MCNGQVVWVLVQGMENKTSSLTLGGGPESFGFLEVKFIIHFHHYHGSSVVPEQSMHEEILVQFLTEVAFE